MFAICLSVCVHKSFAPPRKLLLHTPLKRRYASLSTDCFVLGFCLAQLDINQYIKQANHIVIEKKIPRNIYVSPILQGMRLYASARATRVYA